jgi:site-specific recombinase XerD
MAKGTELQLIQEALRHASGKSTETYTLITTKGFENIVIPMDGVDI